MKVTKRIDVKSQILIKLPFAFMQARESTRTTVVQLQGGDMAHVTGLGAQEILGELDPQTGILYNSDGTQVQLPPGTELKTVMTANGQVSKIEVNQTTSSEMFIVM